MSATRGSRDCRPQPRLPRFSCFCDARRRRAAAARPWPVRAVLDVVHAHAGGHDRHMVLRRHAVPFYMQQAQPAPRPLRRNAGRAAGAPGPGRRRARPPRGHGHPPLLRARPRLPRANVCCGFATSSSGRAQPRRVSVAELCSRLVARLRPPSASASRSRCSTGWRGPTTRSATPKPRCSHEIARHLGLGPVFDGFPFQWTSRFRRARSALRRSGPDRRSSGRRLGCPAARRPTEIKQAGGTLSKEHHPDRVTHLGEEFRRVAEARMRAHQRRLRRAEGSGHGRLRKWRESPAQSPPSFYKRQDATRPTLTLVIA